MLLLGNALVIKLLIFMPKDPLRLKLREQRRWFMIPVGGHGLWGRGVPGAVPLDPLGGGDTPTPTTIDMRWQQQCANVPCGDSIGGLQGGHPCQGRGRRRWRTPQGCQEAEWLFLWEDQKGMCPPPQPPKAAGRFLHAAAVEQGAIWTCWPARAPHWGAGGGGQG